MTTKKSVKDFISKKKIAVAGVSRDAKKFGYLIFSELRNKEYTVYPVNPNADKIDDVTCYQNISDLPDDVESILIATNKLHTDKLIQDSIDKGILNIWVQQNSQTKESLNYLENDSINIIFNHCIFMFAEPVSGIHKFHRFLKGLFGGLPK